MTDKNLVKRINENPEAFSEVIDAYQDKLMKYILRITDMPYEDAESLLQDIFIKVYRYINEYDERYSFSSWIYRIAHNMSIDHFRKNEKYSANISLDDEEYANVISSLTDGENPHSEMKKTDLRDCVQKSISLLPKDYKEAIILKCIEGYSYEDISDILKIPV